MLMVVDARCWCQRNKSPAVVSLQPVRVDHILSPVRPSVRLSVCLVPICGGSTAARTGRPFRLSWLAIFDRPSPFRNPVFANARCGESRALKRVRCRVEWGKTPPWGKTPTVVIFNSMVNIIVSAFKTSMPGFLGVYF